MYCSKQDTAKSEYAVCRTAPNKNCRPCIETCSPIQGFHLIIPSWGTKGRQNWDEWLLAVQAIAYFHLTLLLGAGGLDYSKKKADTQYSANKVQNIKKQSWNDYDMETLWKKMVLKGAIYSVLYLIYKDNLMMFTRGN